MIRGHISSDIQDLNKLHQEYWWIPDETMIRPYQNVLEDKRTFSQHVLSTWRGFRDFILNTHFQYKMIKNDDGKLCIADLISADEAEWELAQSLFPYAVPDGVHHSVLWNSYYDYFVAFSHTDINSILTRKLRGLLGHNNFDFAWYVNPKPSIPELWHCQVFWVEL